MSDATTFFERPYPSANSVLIHGQTPILVDTGFGSDVLELERWLNEQGVSPAALSLVVNTHHHSDHVGGNHHLHTQHGRPVAAHVWEGRAVNRRDPEACLARWLTQPVQAYHVTQLLRDGDTLSTGDTTWHVIHTPGHSLGHVVLHQPELRAAITGDALMNGDIGWLNFHRDGINALDRALDSLDRLAELDLQVAYPGHGSIITDVPAALESSRARLKNMQDDPLKAAWHGSKRIFAFSLMIDGPMSQTDLQNYPLHSPWVADYARDYFHVTPQVFFAQLIQEMTRSGAAQWQDEQLGISGPYRPPQRGWATTPTRVSEWPPGPTELP